MFECQVCVVLRRRAGVIPPTLAILLVEVGADVQKAAQMTMVGLALMSGSSLDGRTSDALENLAIVARADDDVHGGFSRPVFQQEGFEQFMDVLRS